METNRKRPEPIYCKPVGGINTVPEFIDPGLPADGDTASLINPNEKPAFRMESKNTNNGLEVQLLGRTRVQKTRISQVDYWPPSISAELLL